MRDVSDQEGWHRAKENTKTFMTATRNTEGQHQLAINMWMREFTNAVSAYAIQNAEEQIGRGKCKSYMVRYDDKEVTMNKLCRERQFEDTRNGGKAAAFWATMAN